MKTLLGLALGVALAAAPAAGPRFAALAARLPRTTLPGLTKAAGQRSSQSPPTRR